MKNLLYFVSALLFVSSCSTDLNVLADYKETMVVYGLLNQSDTAQYIKINKAFLGLGNALEFAQTYDSINYTNQLTVQLEQWKNDNKTSTITLTRDSSIAKPAGLFSSPKQILYKTKTALDQNSQYNLIVKNNATQNVATASTVLVNDFLITRPFSATMIFSSPTNKFKLEWTSALNGKVYGVVIRFYYIEEDRLSGVKTPMSVDWNLGNKTSLTTAGGEVMSIDFLGEEFYRFLKSKIVVNPAVKRYLPTSGSHLDIIFSVGGADLQTFISVSQPSTGIIQEKPQFTNIKNGYGVFSARYTKYFNANNNPNLLNAQSIDSLYGGQHTKNLFCNPNSLSIYFCN